MKAKPGEVLIWGYPAVIVLKDSYGEFEVLDGIINNDVHRDAGLDYERIYDAIRKREEDSRLRIVWFESNSSFDSNQTIERKKY